jgi:UDP-N-acetylglucosamine:LPS N-acetylglucosamine transferase
VNILLFTRGWGRGHAIPDLAIVGELRRLRDDIQVRFVSYATGADTLREFGHEVVDLDLPARNSQLETQVRATRVIGNMGPDLVIAHEEFTAMPAAKVFGIPALFLTDFFTAPKSFAMQAMGYADEVIFTGEPGVFEEPEQVRGRVTYVGPVLREFRFSKADRRQAREELGLRQETLVISVMPGSWNEQQAPLFDLLAAAADSLPGDRKSIIWIADQDYDALCERARNHPYLSVVRIDPEIDRLMAASDLAITKANRVTCVELGVLGIPSISVTFDLNPPDDEVVMRIPSNVHLRAKEIDAASLARIMSETLEKAATNPPAPAPPKKNGRVGAAERISYHLDRIKQERAPAQT